MIDITAENFELGVLTTETHKSIVFVPTMQIGPGQFAPIGIRITFHVDRLSAAKIAKELSDAVGMNGDGGSLIEVKEKDDA